MFLRYPISWAFHRPRYFSKCFKSFYGVSPQNCRKGKNKSEESEED